MTSALSPQAVRTALDSGDPLAVIDVRDPLDYVQGHVLESTFVPRHDLERRLPTLVPNPATPVVLCDRCGDRAARDARWLADLGYEDVSFLDGGVDAWAAAGFELVESVGHVHATALNYTSKRFGEEVDADRDLPRLTPSELAEMQSEESVLVVDVRNPEEYRRWGTVPGSVNVEGVDLALYAEALRETEETPVVVHCAGRTRSIIGTATLDALGVPNVYELENGTMGWQLAGRDLADGSGRPADVAPDPTRVDRLRERVASLLVEADVPRLTPTEVDELRASVAADQSVYLVDVRREAEYEREHVPGATWVPGGQLLQTAEAHLAVRTAEIVLVSETHVRAGITAYWLASMGFPHVSVLDGGVTAWTDEGRPVAEGVDEPEPPDADSVRATVDFVDARALSTRLEDGGPTVLDVDDPDAFVEAHVPGARWTSRYDLEADLAAGTVDASEPLVLTCRDGTCSTYAAAAVGVAFPDLEVAALRGGVESWRETGLAVAEGEEGMVRPPRAVERKPYGQGSAEMRRYLEWEESLVER
ncbi:hypothetical protein C2R22_03300 [Salinigranum rubrum]|uniref:Rhodanese domain-containing protein n=1 Tax=Salinigranum rubrum TaxID=755307 RepID=A0A2I8VFU0_9EURY|nr:rhodanese-like domain-containing protein [Salinigranum rubrum]AUV80802.1 hypothetical protein C2R22_03300 [Salinigranum rubrum]